MTKQVQRALEHRHRGYTVIIRHKREDRQSKSWKRYGPLNPWKRFKMNKSAKRQKKHANSEQRSDEKITGKDSNSPIWKTPGIQNVRKYWATIESTKFEKKVSLKATKKTKVWPGFVPGICQLEVSYLDPALGAVPCCSFNIGTVIFLRKLIYINVGTRVTLNFQQYIRAPSEVTLTFPGNSSLLNKIYSLPYNSYFSSLSEENYSIVDPSIARRCLWNARLIHLNCSRMFTMVRKLTTAPFSVFPKFPSVI